MFSLTNWLNSIFPPPGSSNTNPTTIVSTPVPSQPQQRTPFYPATPPRVDNSNQPWYGGDDSWAAGPGTVQTSDPVTETSAGNTATNMGSIWTTINSWFGTPTTAKDNLSDPSQVYSPDSQVTDPSAVGGSSMTQTDSTTYGGYGSDSNTADGSSAGGVVMAPGRATRMPPGNRGWRQRLIGYRG